MSCSHVVLGTDFSADSREAAEVAARLQAADVPMRVVHAVPPPMPLGTGLGIYPAGGALVYPMPLETRPIRERLEQWVRDCGLTNAEAVLTEGAPGASLAHEAQETNADLIVLGARGHSAIERVLLGTTAASVLNHAHTDVLLVRNHRFAPNGAPFARIAVATDFGASSVLAARRAHELAERFGADLFLMHARDETVEGGAEVLMTRLEAFNIDYLGGRAAIRVDMGPAARTLRHMVEKENADLLVVGTHGGGILERWIMGSVARTVAEDAPCSVLVARREKPHGRGHARA